MIKFFKITLFLIAIIDCVDANAQQDAQYSQYMFNSLVINPAYAGYKEVISIDVLTRMQWVGIDGAPQTQSLVADGSFFDDKVGIGISVVNDKLGLQSQKSAYLNGSYRLLVGNNARLAFGLGVGLSQYGLDGSRAQTDNPNDPNFLYANSSFRVPDARAGIHFSNDKFYVGFSSTNLLSSIYDYGSATKNSIARQGRHFFLTGGYLFELSDFVKLKPSFLIKEDTKGPSNLDINNFVLLGDKVWLGASYRTSVNLINKKGVQGNVKAPDAVVGIVEFYAGPVWRLGYAYDYTLSGLQGFSGASHEISLCYTFGPKRRVSILSPRYF